MGVTSGTRLQLAGAGGAKPCCTGMAQEVESEVRRVVKTEEGAGGRVRHNCT